MGRGWGPGRQSPQQVRCDVGARSWVPGRPSLHPYCGLSSLPGVSDCSVSPHPVFRDSRGQGTSSRRFVFPFVVACACVAGECPSLSAVRSQGLCRARRLIKPGTALSFRQNLQVLSGLSPGKLRGPSGKLGIEPRSESSVLPAAMSLQPCERFKSGNFCRGAQVLSPHCWSRLRVCALGVALGQNQRQEVCRMISERTMQVCNRTNA